jgi:hypothetical protein
MRVKQPHPKRAIDFDRVFPPPARPRRRPPPPSECSSSSSSSAHPVVDESEVARPRADDPPPELPRSPPVARKPRDAAVDWTQGRGLEVMRAMYPLYQSKAIPSLAALAGAVSAAMGTQYTFASMRRIVATLRRKDLL